MAGMVTSDSHELLVDTIGGAAAIAIAVSTAGGASEPVTGVGPAIEGLLRWSKLSIKDVNVRQTPMFLVNQFMVWRGAHRTNVTQGNEREPVVRINKFMTPVQ